MARGSIDILADLDDLLPDSSSRTSKINMQSVRVSSTRGSLSLPSSLALAGAQASMQPVQPASLEVAKAADDDLPDDDFRSPLKASVPRADLEHARQAALQGAEGPLQVLNNHVAVAQPAEPPPSKMLLPPKQDAAVAERLDRPSTAALLNTQEVGAAAPTSGAVSNKSGGAEKQLPPSFSFQDIMQRRPGSAGQLTPALLGKPPLPRLPGKAGLPQLAACANCEALEKQAKELRTQLGSREEECLELDAQCEALEQLVRDREAQVLEIEGIAGEQGLRIQELERAIGEVTAAAVEAASAAAAEKGGATAELQGRLEEAVKVHAARESALAAEKEAAEAGSRAAQDQASRLQAEVTALQAQLRVKDASMAEVQDDMQHRERELQAARSALAKERAEVAAGQAALAAGQRDMHSRQAGLGQQQDELDMLQRKLNAKKHSAAAGTQRWEQERAACTRELARLTAERRGARAECERAATAQIALAQQVQRCCAAGAQVPLPWALPHADHVAAHVNGA